MKFSHVKRATLVLSIVLLSLVSLSSSNRVLAASSSGCGPRTYEGGCDLPALMNESLEKCDNAFCWAFGFTTAIVATGNIIVEGDSYFDTSAPGTGPTGLPMKDTNPGLLGFMGKGIGAMYENRSFGTTDYLASLNPFKTVSAAGIDVLNPVLNVWLAFRNLAYALIVISLVAFGFLIMFRYKLDPRTVINLTDALPRVVVALILITFSYTIVGLIIDGSKLLENMVNNTIGPSLKAKLAGASVDAKKIRDKLNKDDFPVNYSYKDIIEDYFGSFGGLDLACIGAGSSSCAHKGLINNVAQLVFNFMIISLALSLLFALLKSFASFFLLAIFGPLVFLWSVLPGQENTSTTWFMQLLSAALIFPTVYLLLNISYYIGLIMSGPSATVLYPPGISASLPNIISTDAATVGQLIKIGLLLFTSKVPDLIEEALKAAPKGMHGGVDLKGSAKKVPFIGGFLG